MAKFNPDINPTADASYLGLSKPITQPESDKSLGLLFKGIGDVVEGAVKGADTVMKRSIDNDVYSAIDSERDNYAIGLDKAKATVTGRPTDDPANPEGSVGLLPIGQKAPENLETTINSVSSLQGAYTAGKLSPTYYYARLNAIAKDMRSQYPGYRDYIDSKISSVTGVTPANAYIQSITADINHSMEKKNSENEKVLSFLRQHAQLKDMDKFYDGYTAGRISANDIYREVNKQMNYKYELGVREDERKDRAGRREDVSVAAHTDANREAAVEANRTFSTLSTVSGLTGQKVQDLIMKSASGTAILDDAQAAQLGVAIQGMKKTYQADMWKKFSKVENGRSMITDLGTDGASKAQKIIQDNAALYDLVADAIQNKDYGAAVYHMKQSEAMLADTRHQLYTDPKIGEYQKKLTIMNKDGGPEFAKLLFQKGLMSNVDQRYKEWANDTQMGYITQPDFRTNGSYRTIIEDVQKGKKAGITDRELYLQLTQGTTEYITNPKTPDAIKINAANAAFDPKNNGLISEFSRDGVDPKTGKYRPGQYAIFTNMTSPEVTKEMFRLGQKDPALWTKYKGWVENTFASELFNKEIMDLQGIQKLPNDVIKWDDVNHRFELMPFDKSAKLREGKLQPSIASTQFFQDYQSRAQAQASLNRINMGLKSVTNTVKAAGEDPNAYVLNLLIGMGYDPTKGGDLIPQAMVSAIRNTVIRDKLKAK